ncbi:MAG: hypothetical protein D3924_15570 [Candidatus Electrothrix sp. AR4]|nr:hypothetical protein [Candidatus Electrothrix sp. AR4]
MHNAHACPALKSQRHSGVESLILKEVGMRHLYRQSLLSSLFLLTKKKNLVFALLLISLFLPTILSAAQVLSESFTDCVLPESWEVVDLDPSPLSAACNWMFFHDHAPLMFNDTGGEGCFALADSAHCWSEENRLVDTFLLTPSMNCSGMRETRLTFNYDALASAPTSNSTFTVDISTNGGVDWTELWSRTSNDPGPQTATIDISAIADRQPSVRIRFNYSASNELYWQLDDVTVSGRRTSNLSWLILLLNKTK